MEHQMTKTIGEISIAGALLGDLWDAASDCCLLDLILDLAMDVEFILWQKLSFLQNRYKLQHDKVNVLTSI